MTIPTRPSGVLLLLLAFFAGYGGAVTHGQIQRLVVGGPEIKTSALIQAVGDDGLIASVSTLGGSEAGYVFFCRPAEATPIYKCASISSLTANPHPTWGFQMLRLNATYQSNTTSRDDVFFVGWGNHGAAFFPPNYGPTYAPGRHVLKVYGDLEVTGDIRKVLY